MKCAWRFLVEECDHAGIWSIDMEQMSFSIGERVCLDELLQSLNTQDKENRVVQVGTDQLFIPGFIDFQYGELREDCNPHKSVIQRLKKLTLWEGFMKGTPGVQDQDKDKDQDQDLSFSDLEKLKDPEKEKDLEIHNEDLLEVKSPEKPTPPDLKAVWNEHRGELCECREFSADRRKAWKRYWDDTPDLSYWQEVIRRMAVTPFLRGESDSGWKADIDFFLTRKKLTRFLEGFYDGGPRGRPKTREELVSEANGETFEAIERGEI